MTGRPDKHGLSPFLHLLFVCPEILPWFNKGEFFHAALQTDQDLYDRLHQPGVNIAFITPEFVAFFDILLNVQNLRKFYEFFIAFRCIDYTFDCSVSQCFGLAAAL
jgi:hypothetical protein